MLPLLVDPRSRQYYSQEQSRQTQAPQGQAHGQECPVDMARVRPHALEGLIRSDGSIDWSPWYLSEEEDMGQSAQQGEIIRMLESSLQCLGEMRGWRSVYVGGDNFFAWVPGEPLVQVSPDLYILDEPPPAEQELPRRWETWRAEHNIPRFVAEIVSQDWKKDYAINPNRYDHLGVNELLIADPEACFPEIAAKGSRVPLQLYRRNEHNRLVLVYRGDGPAYSRELDAYVCTVWISPGRVRLRISLDEAGQELVPTSDERIKAAEERIRAQEAELEALRARLRELDSP